MFTVKNLFDEINNVMDDFILGEEEGMSSSLDCSYSYIAGDIKNLYKVLHRAKDSNYCVFNLMSFLQGETAVLFNNMANTPFRGKASDSRKIRGSLSSMKMIERAYNERTSKNKL